MSASRLQRNVICNPILSKLSIKYQVLPRRYVTVLKLPSLPIISMPLKYPNIQLSHCNFPSSIQRCMKCTSVSSTESICWNCNTELKISSLFCQSCHCLNRMNKSISHFDVFGISEKFNIDVGELSKKFKALQAQLHPDKFTLKSKQELDISTDVSAIINSAYSALVHPLNRGLYMLERKGESLLESEIVMESSFLIEIMEINELISETNDLSTIQKIGTKNKATMLNLFIKVEDAFTSGKIAEVKSYIAELKYYTNIDDKVRQIEQKHGIYHN